MREPIIRLVGVSKIYETGEAPVQALRNVSLDIEEGEIFGIIGLSGAGKSTLVRCINLLEEPTEGDVFVDGRDMRALSAKELRLARRGIGMIFQGFNLLMQKNVLDNVCFPLLLSGMSKRDAAVKAKRLLETVGLSEKANVYPAQLSGGQKQRVAIARALATEPKVLLCDEATSALDPTTTKSILDLLRQLNRELNVTVVIITHEMKVVEQICTRVAILADSAIAELGTVEEIFRRPKTDAARKLILPSNEEPAAPELGEGQYLRLVFDGIGASKPILAETVLACGYPVGIVYANTKNINGQLFGSMIIQLPDEEEAALKVKRYLKTAGVTYGEVR